MFLQSRKIENLFKNFTSDVFFCQTEEKYVNIALKSAMIYMFVFF